MIVKTDRHVQRNWVDDRAWICLAELYWWQFSGRNNKAWVEDSEKRYEEARNEGRFSNRDGFGLVQLASKFKSGRYDHHEQQYESDGHCCVYVVRSDTRTGVSITMQ